MRPKLNAWISERCNKKRIGLRLAYCEIADVNSPVVKGVCQEKGFGMV